MTEDDLNGLMHRVLMDALRMEWTDTLDRAQPMEASRKFQHQMKVMLADPFAWYRKKIRPIWKKALRTAAVIIIASSLTFGTLIASSPVIRAAVIEWVREWYETHIVYRYSGEAIYEEMPQYEIINLPEGYTEIDRFISSGYVSVTYQNEDGLPLYLDYSFIQHGSATDFVTDNMDVSDIIVNGCTGQLFLSADSKQSSAITWIDGKKNIQFTLNGFSDSTNLVYMAESITLITSIK